MCRVDLKPCPFCGGKARIRKYVDIAFLVHKSNCYMAQCDNCGCGTSYESSEAHAEATWNRRAPSEGI